MDPAMVRWERIDAVLEQVLDLPPMARRQAVERLCADDPGLRLAVENLLVADESAGSFLEQPVLEAAADLLAGPAEPAPSREGERIGPYRLVRELGHGGMGAVYLAERADGQFEQQVALKLVRTGRLTNDTAQRFRAERQILARLEHPGIASLLDGGVTGSGEPWFAMEYVRGEPLTGWCDARRLGLRERVALFESVCEAVRFAHRNLVVHRDLKPSNILVDDSGRVRLLDFGIAKLLQSEGDTGAPAEATRTGLWALTPEYGAPEQVLGEAVTTATDVYALGAVLYELLSGHRAHRFERYTPLEIERTVCRDDPPPPSEVASRAGTRRHRDGREEMVDPGAVALARGTTPDRLRRELAGDLDAIVLTALQKDPARRFHSAEALLGDLERWRTGLPVRARRDTMGYRTRKFVSRHRWPVAGAGLLVLAIAAGIGATLWQAGQARQEARRARGVTEFLIGLFEVANPEESRGREITARELLALGVRGLDTALVGDPRTQVDLLRALGVIHRNLGLYNEADTLLRRGAALAETVDGGDGVVTAGLLTDLGAVLRYQGSISAADSVLTRALAIRRRRLGREHPEVALTMGELANTHHAAGDDSTAEALFQQVLSLDTIAHGAGSLVLASDLDNFAAMLLDADRPERAIPLIRQGLAIRLAQLDSLHPSVLNSLHNLGAALRALDSLEQAERVARLVLAGYRRLHPDGHPDVAFSLHSLGSVLEDAGNYPEADSAYREAIALRSRFLGPTHWLTLGTLNNLGTMRFRSGDLAGAEQAMREVVEGQRAALGPDHHYTVTAVNNLGVILREQGRHAEAEPLLRQALEGRIRARGPAHSEVRATVRHLGILYRRIGRLDRLETVYRLWIEALQTRDPEATTVLTAAEAGLDSVRRERRGP